MTNNIQKVIEEGLKEVDCLENLKMQVESWDCDADCYVDREKIKAHLSTTISNVLQAIEEEVEGKLRERPINHMNDIITAFLEKETMSEEEKQHIRNKDNGFYIKNVEYVIHNNALSDVLTLLKSARESIK